MKVVITGGSKGIGRAIAGAFARKGASVAICARGEAQLEATREELYEINPHAEHICFRADCSQKAELLSFCGKVADVYQDIDVLVNNAGLYRESDLFGPDRLGSAGELLEATLAVNLMAAWHSSLFFAPGMKARKSGHIFNICSVASLRAVPGAGAYVISKHALLGLSRSLAAELKPSGVRVTAIIPGATLTASWEGAETDPAHFVAASDVAAAVLNANSLSAASNIDELLITPTRAQ